MKCWRGSARNTSWIFVKLLRKNFPVSAYQLLDNALFCLPELFRVENNDDIPYGRLDAGGMRVLLRLEGKVSLSGMDEILDQQGYPQHSTGLPGQCLTSLGASLPNTCAG